MSQHLNIETCNTTPLQKSQSCQTRPDSSNATPMPSGSGLQVASCKLHVLTRSRTVADGSKKKKRNEPPPPRGLSVAFVIHGIVPTHLAHLPNNRPGPGLVLAMGAYRGCDNCRRWKKKVVIHAATIIPGPKRRLTEASPIVQTSATAPGPSARCAHARTSRVKGLASSGLDSNISRPRSPS